MWEQVILARFIEESLRWTFRGHGTRRFKAFARMCPAKQTRISFSSLLKISKGNQYLLIQSNLYPEMFAPIGGVHKYYTASINFLNRAEFVPEADTKKMERDLRGCLPARYLPDLIAWYLSWRDCETVEACVRRELREELEEIHLALKIPEDLAFHVPDSPIFEGPSRVPGEKYMQVRIFHVVTMRQDLPQFQEFESDLWKAAEDGTKGLLIASAEQIESGRGKDRTLIGSQSEYLLGSRKQRPDAPHFHQPSLVEPPQDLPAPTAKS